MSTLILVEHDNKRVHPVTLSALTAAKQLSLPVAMLVIGHQCQSVVEEVRAAAGVDLVLSLDNPSYKQYIAELWAPVLVKLAASYAVILAAATTLGKDCLPRVAAQLDVAQISEVTKILDKKTFEHPIYAGNALEQIESLDAIQVLTIRATAFSSLVEKQVPCKLETLDIKPADSQVSFVSEQLSQSARPELGRAKIVVAGGRGLQSAEKFSLIEQLADAFGGAVGASRAAVDAGFVPNDYQVGQTGKVVAPDLYVAIGISGAIQHLAGMKDSKVIVAINKDEEAPIFQIATYGLVGDLFEIIPELIHGLKQA